MYGEFKGSESFSIHVSPEVPADMMAILQGKELSRSGKRGRTDEWTSNKRGRANNSYPWRCDKRRKACLWHNPAKGYYCRNNRR